MNRNEKWEAQYAIVWTFVEKHHRAPSRHRLEEHDMLNWLKYNRKRLNKGELDEYRKEKMDSLGKLITSFHIRNQYC